MLNTILIVAAALAHQATSMPTPSSEQVQTYNHVWTSPSGCSDKAAYDAFQLSMDIQDNKTATSACHDYCTSDSKCVAVLVDQLFPGSTDSWHQYYKCYLYASSFDATTDVQCGAEPKWYGRVDAYDVSEGS